MHIIINTSSMIPIYEQLVDQIKTQIRKGDLQQDDILPSVRRPLQRIENQRSDCKESIRCAGRRRIYRHCPWKGYLRGCGQQGTAFGRTKKELEADLEKVIQKGRRCGISDEDMKILFALLLEG